MRVSSVASALALTGLLTGLAVAAAVPVGHAHIVHDGVKLAAAYGPVVEIGPLPPGRQRIEAVLRAQDHRALLGAGGLIKGVVVIEVAG